MTAVMPSNTHNVYKNKLMVKKLKVCGSEGLWVIHMDPYDTEYWFN